MIIPSNNSMDCCRLIPKTYLTIGNYTMTYSFYVFNVVDTNLVLGLQWLFSIGEHTTNYMVPEMSFEGVDGN